MNSNAAIKGTAVVTGASAGIGMVYADRLAAQGYDLILVARRADRLNEVAKRLSAQHGIRATALVEDLSKDAGVAAVVAAISADPTITMLVNNAGVATLAGFTDTDLVSESLARIVEKTDRTREEALAELVKHNPQGRLIDPSEVAEAVLWLCGEGARSVTGQAIAVAGGEI